MNTAILGASPKPERYAHRAQVELLAQGHRAFPISPQGATILDTPGYTSILEIEEPIDTLTLYLSPSRLRPLVTDIIQASPRRVIFNPGTEARDVAEQLQGAGIETLEACTLVMLATGSF
ncbi:MAG: CoA-binding protein [Verrucomicrobiota bacterium JB023]|nr:CoA-binding protein [Verrucomicrobiota bacterium JB023]